MNIGIDIDDTISETFETLLPYAQRYTIEDLKKESKVHLDGNLKNHFYIVYMNDWDEKEATDFWSRYYGELLKKLNIKTFAADVIKKLKKQGNKIYLITARWEMRSDNVKKITETWLKENDVEYDYLFMNADDKLKIIQENNIDIFIDDSFNNCKKIVDNSDTTVYMMTSRVNCNLEDDKITRVFSWPQIYDLISREEKK